jgi:aminoglycoside phosphotransferase (APT) family kinase protein
MAIPDQRDVEVSRTALTHWLAGKLEGAEDVCLPEFATPSSATGFSSETLLFTVTWTADGRPQRRDLVARVAPIAFQIFPEPRFPEQYRLMRLLADETEIPVPPVHWYEPDASILGAPFFVMDRIDGQVPSDVPPYHADGWLTTASPAERGRIWWNGLDMLARIHRLDVDALGLRFLDSPEWGRTGIDQQLGYYDSYLTWANPGSNPVAEAALAWLRENQPEETGPPALLWGDARIGNIIFSAGVPQAVLDWEMATLGQPEEDLAWFLYLDRHHSEGIGAERLEGFPSTVETVEAYERLLGRPMRNLRYYEVFAGFRFAVAMARIGQLLIHYGMVPPDSDFPVNNTATSLLATVLGLPSPGAGSVGAVALDAANAAATGPT